MVSMLLAKRRLISTVLFASKNIYQVKLCRAFWRAAERSVSNRYAYLTCAKEVHVGEPRQLISSSRPTLRVRAPDKSGRQLPPTEATLR
jgi:hypothetical protein